FIWEGVVHYIPESAVRDILHFVRVHSAPGSMIAFDYALSRNPFVNNPDTIYARWGEPWIFGFPGEGAAEFVRREGLEIVQDDLLGSGNSRYTRRSDGSSSLPLDPAPQARGGAGLCIARVPSRH